MNDGGSSFNHETCSLVSQRESRGPHVQKRSQGLLPAGSRVPHGTVRNGVLVLCKRPTGREASMRSLARFYAGSCTLLGQHGRVFTPGPVPGNPPKRDSVVKVLEQGY